MDADCYLKRTEKIIAILRADLRLSEDVETDVTVRMGRPESMTAAETGHHVWVSWDGTPSVRNRRWGGGHLQDHRATFRVSVVTCDYTSVDDAERQFELLLANVGRVMADRLNLQIADYWINLEQDGFETTTMPIGSNRFWRVGWAQFHATFQEAIN